MINSNLANPSKALLLYIENMEEIKLRRTALENILNGVTTTGFLPTNIEFVFLQIRHILELIALSALVICEDEHANLAKSFLKMWHADNIFTEIKKLNMDFYPKPVRTSMVNNQVRVQFHQNGYEYLTEDDFGELYGRCGNFLHNRTLRKSRLDKSGYLKEKEYIVHSINKINNLLVEHYIEIKNDDFYTIEMVGGHNNTVLGKSCTKL